MTTTLGTQSPPRVAIPPMTSTSHSDPSYNFYNFQVTPASTNLPPSKSSSQGSSNKVRKQGPCDGHQRTPLSMSKAKLIVIAVCGILAMRVFVSSSPHSSGTPTMNGIVEGEGSLLEVLYEHQHTPLSLLVIPLTTSGMSCSDSAPLELRCKKWSGTTHPKRTKGAWAPRHFTLTHPYFQKNEEWGKYLSERRKCLFKKRN